MHNYETSMANVCWAAPLESDEDFKFAAFTARFRWQADLDLKDWEHTHTCARTRTRAHAHLHAHTYVYIHVGAHAYTRIRTHTHTQSLTCTHTHTHEHAHTERHVCVCVCVCVCLSFHIFIPQCVAAFTAVLTTNMQVLHMYVHDAIFYPSIHVWLQPFLQLLQILCRITEDLNKPEIVQRDIVNW